MPAPAPRARSTSPPTTGCRTTRARSSRCAAPSPQNDLISNFALAEIDGDRLDDREVLLTTTTLIMAGVESLGGFMMMFAYNLATFDEARRAVVANPALLPDAIEESLRFNTSAQRFRRRLMKDVTLHGQTMKEGDFVCLAYGSGNRDERQYPNPDAYDITRKPRGHLGFGGGVHACLGTAIARLAVKIAFEEFHQVVPDYRAWPTSCPGCLRPPSAARWCCSSRPSKFNAERPRWHTSPLSRPTASPPPSTWPTAGA
jgi:cytochrome P450